MDKTCFCFSKQWLQLESYIDILTNSEQRHISRPPIKPKPGEIYVYVNDKCTEDWKADQCRWINKGNKGLPGKDPQVRVHYFTNFASEHFQKRAYTEYNRNSLYGPKTVIHYVGSMEDVTGLPHGNSKEVNPRPFIPTAKSQIQAQKSVVNNTDKPKEVYRQLIATDVHPAHAPVLLPRNPKQVSNTVSNEKERRLLSRDDIVGTYLVGHELENYVQKFQLLPHFVAVLCSPGMIEQFTLQSHIGGPLYYDTTFALGDFYVSVFTFTHMMFKNRPCIPLSYLIHHTKMTEVHKTMFDTMLDICPAAKGLPVVTDREKSITNAIRDSLDKSINYFCWNHIQQDVIHWTKSQKGSDTTDESTYSNQVWDLLDSDSLDAFNQKYDGMSKYWSKQFKQYFDKYLLKDVQCSGKWELQKAGLYVKGSGVTINPSESVNAVLKRFLKQKEVKMQVLALSLYQLDLSFQKEIARGFVGQGEYKLSTEYEDLQQEPETVTFPKSHLPLDQLPYIFQNEDLKLVKQDDHEKPYTKYGIAKQLVLEGKVTHVPQEQVFIVSSTEKKYLVSLYPKATCTCSVKTNCHHIQAVKISVGDVQKPPKLLKLNTLMRKTRGHKAGRKNVPRNVTLIDAADDSLEKIANAHNAVHHFVEVPVKRESCTVVKKRFVETPQSKVKAFKLKPTATSTPAYAMQSVEVTNTDEEDNNLESIAIESEAKHCEQQTYFNKSTTVAIQLPDDGADSDLEFQSCATDTFEEKCRKNKEFTVFGTKIYFDVLEPLTKHIFNATPYELFVGESVITCYHGILCHEEKEKNSRLTILTTECLLSFSGCDTEHPTFYSLCQFLKYRIPDQDIVIFPVVQSSHCTLLIALKKQKMIIYLDSFRNLPPKNVMTVMKRLYDSYYKFFEIDSCFNEYTLYAPQDVPRQTNGYDCALYACMYAETLLRRSRDVLKFHDHNNMFGYRQVVYDMLVKYMKKPTKPVRNARVYNKKNLEKFQMVEATKCNLHFKRKLDNKQETMTFLSTLVDTYWEENSTQCNDNYCNGPDGKMVYCDKCCHWYHLKCVDLAEENLPKRFLCKSCKKPEI